MIAIVAVLATIGHAAISTWTLNVLYGMPLPKRFLRAYRLGIGLWILAYPIAFYFMWEWTGFRWYSTACSLFTLLVFVPVTIWRLLKRRPRCVLEESTVTIDYWQVLGPTIVGDGKGQLATRLPGTCAFKVDFTSMMLAVPNLPEACDGLRIQLVSDVHFHGTPSRDYFDAVIDRLANEPTPDFVILAGDYLDSDPHIEWIEPILGKLNATVGRYAVLGNHDLHHKPDAIRQTLTDAGYHVLGNDWQTVEVCGETFITDRQRRPVVRLRPRFSERA